MSCGYCKYLAEADKKEGAGNGALYYCSKKKKCGNGNDCACDDYYKDYGRSTSTINEIYHDGKDYNNDGTDPGTYLIILVVMVITLSLLKLFVG